MESGRGRYQLQPVNQPQTFVEQLAVTFNAEAGYEKYAGK